MIKKTAFAAAVIAAGVSAQAQEAAKSDLSVTVDVTYVSDYVFRGVQLGDASIQPSVEAAYGDFYAGAWHTSEISHNDGDTETDFYAGYGYKLNDKIKLDAGATAYTYDGGSDLDTIEGYVGASFDVLLSPSVYYYFDFDLDVSTIEASIGYSIPVDAINASVDLSAKVGNVSGGIVDHHQDYTYGVAGVAVPFKLSETATLTVGADYIINDSENVGGSGASGLQTFGNGDNDIVVGKAGISIGF